MITPSTIYWLTRATALSNLFTLAMILAGCVLVFAGLAHTVMDMEPQSDEAWTKMMGRIAKRSGIVFIVSSILTVAMPTTKELAAIIVIPKVANSESVQQLGDGIVDLAKQWLTELAPKKGGEE